MQIGLIGGIGPAATDYYYRRLIRRFADVGMALDVTIVHADVATLLANLARAAPAAQATLFAALTARLAACGAGCVAVTSIAGHFCRTEFAALSALPVIDMIDAVNRHIAARSYRRLGILGTGTVMRSRFYGGGGAATILPPDGQELEAVHQAYVDMAAAGTVTDAQRAIFHTAARRLIEEQGAEAIMLGGTDLALAFDQDSAAFPLVDCAAIHVDAIADQCNCPTISP